MNIILKTLKELKQDTQGCNKQSRILPVYTNELCDKMKQATRIFDKLIDDTIYYKLEVVNQINALSIIKITLINFDSTI